MEQLATAFGGSAVVADGKDAGGEASVARRSLSERRQRPRVPREHHRRRHRHQPDGGDAGRLQRSRLGACESLAGRGPRLSHRPDAHGQRHLHGRGRHDRRLRPGACSRRRPRSSARSSTAQAMAPDLSRATCWTSCSVRCARCRLALADSARRHRRTRIWSIGCSRQARLDLGGELDRRASGAEARTPEETDGPQARARVAGQGALGTVRRALPLREHVARRASSTS